jgi:hypothetical protein
VTVNNGVTLTVNAGTEVRFGQYNTLIVNGALDLNGTASRSVQFTASSTAPSAGYWSGIVFGGATSTVDISCAAIRYCGSGGGCI